MAESHRLFDNYFMGRTHDITISGFDLSRLESELAVEKETAKRWEERAWELFNESKKNDSIAAKLASVEEELKRVHSCYCHSQQQVISLAAENSRLQAEAQKYFREMGRAWTEREERDAEIMRLERESVKLREGILKAWQAMDSYGTAKSDEWKEEWKHILSNERITHD